MHNENPGPTDDIINKGLTGFFNEGNKRIDLVLVIKYETEINNTSNMYAEELRVGFLMNAIKFGFELELEEGSLPEHRNLIFVKVHAPDPIIEEYGIYFNERKFFKDMHADLINPIFNPLDMTHEREIIKIIREQILDRPSNYSTLDRSMTVYKIFLQLPFGKHENQFGVNKLIKNGIILDSFALHDGPYFLPSDQGGNRLNGRQALFYNWLGWLNVWKMQPIHMIQEYLGARVAFYFAYYEYFIWMLIFPAVTGLWIAITHLHRGPDYSKYAVMYEACDPSGEGHICPQCRNFQICQPRHVHRFCREVHFINVIDTENTFYYAISISLWATVFPLLWKRQEKYLAWMWEINERYVKKLTKPEYYGVRRLCRSDLTGITLDYDSNISMLKRGLFVLIAAASFGAWLFCLFVFSIYIWHIKHFMYNNDEFYETNESIAQIFHMYIGAYRNALYIGVGAAVYAFVVKIFISFVKVLSYKLTTLENHKTIGSYDESLALKLFGFSISGTFALLTFHTFVGEFPFTHLFDMERWHTIGGYGVMNNGVGSSFDDICVTLAAIIVIQEIIFKIPTYFYNKWSDYEGIYNSRSTPCWEREYKLETLKDDFFHNGYNDIVMLFALATLFSSTFTPAPLLILMTKIWDIRHKARYILLACRRPLLLNSTGPGVWHKLLHLTAFAVPIFNSFVIAYQSLNFLHNYAGNYPVIYYSDQLQKYYRFDNNFLLTNFKGVGSPSEEWAKAPLNDNGCKVDYLRAWITHGKGFIPSEPWNSQVAYKHRFLAASGAIVVLVNLLLHFLLPINSEDIKFALINENRIKEKYLTLKGYLPNQ